MRQIATPCGGIGPLSGDSLGDDCIEVNQITFPGAAIQVWAKCHWRHRTATDVRAAPTRPDRGARSGVEGPGEAKADPNPRKGADLLGVLCGGGEKVHSGQGIPCHPIEAVVGGP